MACRVSSTLLLLILWLTPAWAEVHIDVVPFTALTTASSQSVLGDMDDLQPKGAIVILTGGVIHGTIASHARMSWGAYDGTTQYFYASQADDNQATTDADNWSAKGFVAAIVNVDRSIMCSMVASFVINGISLSQGSGCDDAYQGVVILFGGSDVDFKAGTFVSSGSIGNSVDVSIVGFEPDLVFIGKTKKGDFDHTGDPSYLMNFGISVNHPTGVDPNVGIAHSSQNNLITSNSSMRVQTDSLWTTDVSADDGQLIVEQYDSMGFSVRNQDEALGDEVGYTAIAIKDVRYYLSVVDTPNGLNAGVHNWNGPNFRPQLSLFLTTGADVTNETIETVSPSRDASIMGVMVHDGLDIFSASVSLEDSSASANMKTLTSGSDFKMLQDDGTLGWQGTLTHTGTGASMDFTTNPSTARKWLMLAIEESFVFDRPRVPPIMGQ